MTYACNMHTYAILSENVLHFRHSSFLLIEDEQLETKDCFQLRELDLNQRPLGYEPSELPDCSIPR